MIWVTAKFVKNPTVQSCVDAKTTATNHAMRAIAMVLKASAIKSLIGNQIGATGDVANIIAARATETSASTNGMESSTSSVYADVAVADHDTVQVKNTDGSIIAEEGTTSSMSAEIPTDELIALLTTGNHRKFVERLCCEQITLHDHHYDKTNDAPSIFPRECSKGKCSKCGVCKRLHIIYELQEKLMDDLAEMQVEVNIWAEARQSGKDKRGKYNTQKELTPVYMPLPKFIYFLAMIEVCIPR